jgi:hypothetical protein
MTSGTFVAHVVWIERLSMWATGYALERRTTKADSQPCCESEQVTDDV